MLSRAPRILLVEDNRDDAEMLSLALRRAHKSLALHHVGDGDQALTLLQRCGPPADEPTPDLMILDLNLPCRDGFEVLEAVRRSPHLGCVPVVVLSSSCSASDIGRAYRAHANAYIAKPPDLDFTAVARAIVDFWLQTVRLPTMPWKAAS